MKDKIESVLFIVCVNAALKRMYLIIFNFCFSLGAIPRVRTGLIKLFKGFSTGIRYPFQGFLKSV